MQRRLRQEHIRAVGPHLRGLLQSLQGDESTFLMQEKLFHDRLFQGVSGSTAAYRRNGAGADVDKAIARG